MMMPWQPMVMPAAPLAHVPFHHTSTPNHLILNMINTCREPPGQRDVRNRRGEETLCRLCTRVCDIRSPGCGAGPRGLRCPSGCGVHMELDAHSVQCWPVPWPARNHIRISHHGDPLVYSHSCVTLSPNHMLYCKLHYYRSTILY
jgi:hypothetical protein